MMRPSLPLALLALGLSAAGHADPPRPLAVPVMKLVDRLVAGERKPRLSGSARRAFVAARTAKPIFLIKLCIDREGAPASVTMLKGALPEADEELLAALRAWRFRPYTVEGEAVPVCTAVELRYEITLPKD